MAILNLWYSITRNGDTIIISSNTGLSINIKVSIKESCQDNKYNQIQEYNTTTTISFNLPYDDGKYKIEITNNQNETYTYYIPKYDNMLKSLISDIELILCDCKCKHCNDCTQTTEKDYSSVLLKLLSYYVLNKEYYEAFLKIVFECTECALEDAFKCVLLNEKVYGNSENTELFKKIISHFYLGFYYGKLGYINNLEETNKLFNYDRIYHCIKNSGINTTCIENKKTDMATVNMITDAYINQPASSVGNITLNSPNRAATIYSLASFTGVFVDPENDPLQAIRVNTLPVSGQLMFDTTGSGNWSLVTSGQVILATEISAGRFKFVPPDQNALHNTSWNYSARDSGSMQFVS